MKVALLITTFNRGNYLKDCLWSLERADLSRIDEILFVDDKSTDKEAILLLQDWDLNKPEYNINVVWSQENCGIKKSLLYGYEDLFQRNDIVINLDSDAIVRPDFVERLLDCYEINKGSIITGFNCDTKNANGTERHMLLHETETYNVRKSVGGINLLADKKAYEHFIKPSLNEQGNWDANTFIKAGFACAVKPSVIQHIGFDSSMNHNEAPDVADDFYYWDLPTVTLIGVDSQKERLQRSIDICTKWIRFGEVKLLHEPLNSKEAYSKFCIEDLYKHVKTEYMLICQHDGYVNNWQAWDNDWLQYDYIGAPWHYNDGMAVGNGGFSLRSRRLMEIVATDKNIQIQHPEDHHICRTYRPYLEKTYGIKFSPIEVAEKFSFEGYLQPTKTLKEQFGVHGANPRKVAAQPIKTQRLIFNQYLSLGDILFLIPMARELMNEGNSVLWPIDPLYLSIQKHFKDINFVDKTKYDFPYNNPNVVETQSGKLLPYRFASEKLGLTLKDCMKSKYLLFGHNYLIWRNLTWERDFKNESELIELLELPAKFNLVNRTFGHEAKHTITPIINNDLPCVEMRNIPGFTLIDWLGVVELAHELHISNSSLNYLLELMPLKCDVHIYKRGIWGEQQFEYSRYLFTNERFIYHETP